MCAVCITAEVFDQITVEYITFRKYLKNNMLQYRYHTITLSNSLAVKCNRSVLTRRRNDFGIAKIALSKHVYYQINISGKEICKHKYILNSLSMYMWQYTQRLYFKNVHIHRINLQWDSWVQSISRFSVISVYQQSRRYQLEFVHAVLNHLLFVYKHLILRLRLLYSSFIQVQ
jgi:hypothetical protein